MDLAALAREHLLLKLKPINEALSRAVARQAASVAKLSRPDVTALCVTDEQVALLLAEVGALSEPASIAAGAEPAAEDLARERELRQLSGGRLPFDRLVEELALEPFEQEALLLCVASEVDRRYERIFAYVLDDLNRRQPCVEILCSLTAPDAGTALGRRRLAGRWSRLRRAGLVLPVGDAPTELRQELRAAPALLEWLFAGAGDPASFRDPWEVPLDGSEPLPAGADPLLVERMGEAIADGTLSIAGIFGARGAGQERLVRALAERAGRPLRRLSAESPSALEDGLAAGTALDAIVWLETDPLTEAGNERLRGAVAARLGASRCTLALSGVHAWRPAELLARRAYAEIDLSLPDWEGRKSMWAAALPEASDARRADLAVRYRMSEPELRAVASVARIRASIEGNGHPRPIDEVVDGACATVARKRSDHFATLVRPRRGPADLILAPDPHKQVLEIARFFRAWPKVSEGWKFGRLATGGGGLKALFTGDSGTGKTLAAEVVAGELGVPLLKVDLARVVSKWVGETEKNLETAFTEAEESHSILFFDEADALFGKRGEVSHGTDRYANLEVSYLLQRLEDHQGLVILASNLKEHIDEAFTRRFHVMIHFARPGIEERRRLWKIAFPAAAPVGGDVDFDALSRLDLTGAGIVATARTAALLAADEAAQEIHMPHLIRAARRQYHREARLLTSGDLGRYASMLG